MQQWQLELQQAVTQLNELCELLELKPADLLQGEAATHQFALRVPRGFIARMRKGDPQDPLLLQVLPQAQELITQPGFTQDPLHEKNVNPVPGLLHKYYGRVLLTLAGSCAINCRYCFRRYFPYADNILGTQEWNEALSYIEKNASIKEVILSGGDPLIVKDSQLKKLVTRIAAIPHIKILRIHTRIPIVLPARITKELVDLLSSTHLQVIMVIHANHPQEINDDVSLALTRCRDAKIHLLNQSVLIRRVNDDSEVLVHLSETLFAKGVLPYYLHLLDPVAGTSHFFVDEQRAKQIIAVVQSRLPGYLVPKLVREVPGKSAKVHIAIDKELLCNA